MDKDVSYNKTKNVSLHPIDLDLAINANPSYHIPTKPYSKTSEDEYIYLQPGTSEDGYISMYNPTMSSVKGTKVQSLPTLCVVARDACVAISAYIETLKSRSLFQSLRSLSCSNHDCQPCMIVYACNVGCLKILL